MTLPFPPSSVFIFAGLGLVFFILLGIIAWTTRISLRRGKMEPAPLKYLFAIAFLQVVLGGLTIWAARAIHNDPWIDIGTGLGVTLFSGLFFIKFMLKNEWKRSLLAWAIAALLQAVLLPVCAGLLVVAWLMLYFLLFPPLL